MILVYTTHKTTADAQKTIKHLLQKQLVACANSFPIASTYRWKGKIVNDKEVVTIFKTRDQLWTNVHDEILAIHPYETPCVLRLAADANMEYNLWINRETALSAIGVMHSGAETPKSKVSTRTSAKKK